MLVQRGLEAIGARPGGPSVPGFAESPTESVDTLAAGLLAAMGMKEIAADLDLEAVSLLGAACVTGLQAFSEIEPGAHRLEQALFALEDLLRRTAPAAAR
jgi:hypothetical protein